MNGINPHVPWYSEEAGFFGERYLRDYNNSGMLNDTIRQVDFIEGALGLSLNSDILDVPCGHGRHSIELAKRGHRVVGQDINTQFLNKAEKDARDTNVMIDFVQSDMREIPFREHFDAVLNLFNSFGYLEEESEDQKVLEQIARSLKPQGLLFLDTRNRKGVSESYEREKRSVNDDGSIVLSELNFNFQTGIREEKRTWIECDGTEVSLKKRRRMYSLSELQDMLGKVGLRVLKTFEDYSGSSFEEDSEQLIVISQKI